MVKMHFHVIVKKPYGNDEHHRVVRELTNERQVTEQMLNEVEEYVINTIYRERRGYNPKTLLAAVVCSWQMLHG